MSKIFLYGSVCLRKEYCNKCQSESFVIDGKLQCCDSKIENFTPIKHIIRESETMTNRLSKQFKEHILKIQEYKCYICGTNLTEKLYYIRKNKPQLLRIEFDHFIPKAFCANNETENIYALCNLCNQYKSSKMFEDRESAKKYIIEKREKMGLMQLYTDIEYRAVFANEKM